MNQEEYDEILGYMGRAIAAVILGIITLLVIEMLCSCTRTVYVPQTTIQKDSIYLTQYQRDSIWLHDSVLVKEKGDTVWLEKWHTKYIERVKTDTTYIEKSDTIREPYPVEKALTWKQRTLMNIGRYSIGAIFIIILGALVAFVIHIRRKEV